MKWLIILLLCPYILSLPAEQTVTEDDDSNLRMQKSYVKSSGIKYFPVLNEQNDQFYRPKSTHHSIPIPHIINLHRVVFPDEPYSNIDKDATTQIDASIKRTSTHAQKYAEALHTDNKNIIETFEENKHLTNIEADKATIEKNYEEVTNDEVVEAEREVAVKETLQTNEESMIVDNFPVNAVDEEALETINEAALSDQTLIRNYASKIKEAPNTYRPNDSTDDRILNTNDEPKIEDELETFYEPTTLLNTNDDVAGVRDDDSTKQDSDSENQQADELFTGITFIKESDQNIEILPFDILSDGKIIDHTSAAETSFDFQSIYDGSFYDDSESSIIIGGLNAAYSSFLLSLQESMIGVYIAKSVFIFLEDQFGGIYRLTNDESQSSIDNIKYLGVLESDIDLCEHELFLEMFINAEGIFDDTLIPPICGLSDDLIRSDIKNSNSILGNMQSLAIKYQSESTEPISGDPMAGNQVGIKNQIVGNEFLTISNLFKSAHDNNHILFVPASGAEPTYVSESADLRKYLEQEMGKEDLHFLESLLHMLNTLTSYNYKLLVAQPTASDTPKEFLNVKPDNYDQINKLVDIGMNQILQNVKQNSGLISSNAYIEQPDTGDIEYRPQYHRRPVETPLIQIGIQRTKPFDVYSYRKSVKPSYYHGEVQRYENSYLGGNYDRNYNNYRNRHAIPLPYRANIYKK